MRSVPSSALGLRSQVELIGNNLSCDNVHLERDWLVTGRLKLDSVRACGNRQGLRAAEAARDAYVVTIDVDKGIEWSHSEADSADLRFRWNAGRRGRVSVRRVRLAVVRVGIVVLWVHVVGLVRIAQTPGGIVIVEPTVEVTVMVVVVIMVMVMVAIMTSVIVAVAVAIMAAMISGVRLACHSARPRPRRAMRIPAAAYRVSSAGGLSCSSCRVASARGVCSAAALASHVSGTAAAQTSATAAAHVSTAAHVTSPAALRERS